MTFTLGSLLDQEDLGLELMTGDSSCRSRPVAGVHAIEIAHPMRWLEPAWVMLSTGVRLRNHPAAQRELVAELAQGGLTALGFAEEVIFKSIPRAIVEEAERRGFPVFAIPYETPHRAIVSFVNRSLLSSDFYLLQRSISMQSYLMDALAAERPEDELVRRLGSLFGSTVLIYRPDGRLDAARGEGPAAAIWVEISAREASLQEFSVGRWYVVSVPIRVGEVVRYWLALATRRRSISEQLSKPVLRAAERLLQLVAMTRDTAAAQERAVRSELLRRILTRAPGEDDGALADRMVAFGFEPGATVALAVVAPAGPSPDGLDRARGLLEAQLVASLLPFLLADWDGRLAVLVEGRGRFEDWLRRLARNGVELAAGVGRPFSSLARSAEALADAELALDQLRRDGGPPRVLRFEELDLATWLLGDHGLERLRPKVDAMLAPLRDNAMLYETLLAYLGEDLDVGRTARALHLHPNSLRYRLAQIEQRLGCSLRAPATIANLHLATTADRTARGGRSTVTGSSPRSGPPPPDTALPRAGSDPG